MFHVSTLLPYEPLDRQQVPFCSCLLHIHMHMNLLLNVTIVILQIERKRHIGNDVVTIIFQVHRIFNGLIYNVLYLM